MAGDFLKECRRVLKPGGIIRVVVPDLEAMIRSYLLALENAKMGIEGWNHNYDWMMLEMYDQVVRDQPGGEMARYILDAIIPNEGYVIGRCGTEVRNMIVAGRKSRSGAPVATQSTVPGARKLFDVIPVPSFIRRTYGILRKSGGWKEKLMFTQSARYRLPHPKLSLADFTTLRIQHKYSVLGKSVLVRILKLNG